MMKLSKHLFIIIIIFNLLTTLSLSASSFKNIPIPNTIKFKLNNSDYNKYIKRSMKAYVDGEANNTNNRIVYDLARGTKDGIKKKYKIWTDADLILEDSLIKSKIRILGDGKDHLRLPFTSLKVKILDDSYYGIKRFNLFLPHTRKAENEVFWTLMLSFLDFPSLYTKMVTVDLNGKKYRAIFQEDATKEFLERNNITETVILKQNDFEFYLNNNEKDIYKNYFSLSYVVDNNNFLKNDIAKFIASEAISLMSIEKSDEIILNNNFFIEIMQKYAPHGLGSINRKYIYIPYKKMFVPLYYDGNVQFPPNKVDCTKKVEKKILKSFSDSYLNLTNKNLRPIQKCAFEEIYSKFVNIRDKKNIFISKSHENVYKKKYSTIKNKIINFLNKKEKNQDQISKSILYIFHYKNQYHRCFLDITKNQISICDNINAEDYSKYISKSGDYILVDDFKVFPVNLGTFDKTIPLIEINDDKKEFLLSEEATYLFTNKNIKNESIKFIFKNNKSKVIVQGNFENIDFNFTSSLEESNTELTQTRYDKNLLTGCLNFFDSYFNNVNITGKNMICEDSVNIKNSRGEINNITIQNSSYDAIDLDFSKLKIKSINIKNAKNDCADFSYGTYNINNVVAKLCGDKGISIGEDSKVNLKNILITDSKVGVASKDSSLTTIDKVSMNELNICISAYRKKKEFGGSKIFVKDFDCKNFSKKIFQDSLSTVSIKE